MTQKEEAKSLVRRSREFLETAQYQIDAGFYDLAAFSLEQTLQLFLKAKLLEHGADYPRHHGVRALLELLEKILEKTPRALLKKMINEYILELGMLEDAYISSRYITREFRKEEVVKLKTAVEAVIKGVP